MNSPDIRWKQRFSNFRKVLRLLEQAAAVKQPDIIGKAGQIQFFEMSFELAWKVLKDYLEYAGHTGTSSPRAVLKKAYSEGLIVDGHAWIQLLSDRNLTTHTYEESKADEVISLIKNKYLSLFQKLEQTLEPHADG